MNYRIMKIKPKKHCKMRSKKYNQDNNQNGNQNKDNSKIKIMETKKGLKIINQSSKKFRMGKQN